MVKRLKWVFSLLLAGSMMVFLLILPAEAAEITIHEYIPCQYDGVRFSDDLGWVYIGDDETGTWWCIDETGKPVTPYPYKGFSDFSEGFATVRDSTGKYGVIDRTGTLVVPYLYDSIYRFSEGRAVIENNNMDGLIDTTGKVIVPLGRYRWMSRFSEGLMPVSNASGVGYIDITGKEVIPCSHEYAVPVGSPFSEGLAAMKNPDGKAGYIDKTGKAAIPFRYDGASSFENGFAKVQMGKSPEAKYGLIDAAGREVIPCQYDELEFSEGLAVVRVGHGETVKYGVIDKTGKEIVPLGKYDIIISFSDGFAAVRLGDEQTGKYGFIDTTGKLVVPCQYTRAADFSEGLAMVANSQFKWGYIDSAGREVVPFRYEYSSSFSNGVACVVDSNGRYGYVDKTGKEVVPCQYKTAESFSNGVARVQNSNNKWGCLAIVDTAALSQPEPQPSPTVGGFNDVREADYYATPVLWSVEKGITGGTTKTTFSPNATCTTAQILTFLWRSQGQPEPTIENPFSDVSATDYYYKAALWACEKGLISGTVFNGGTPCTRSNTVTYLWKLAGSPAVSPAAFSDVSDTADYAQAVRRSTWVLDWRGRENVSSWWTWMRRVP